MKTTSDGVMRGGWTAVALTIGLAAASPLAAQQLPPEPDPVFHTFSIVALDPATGETGVAVTTRVACVGNAVPWVRAGVGAVATQASTRVEYGHELLDLLESGVAPDQALARLLAVDEGAARRQVGVVDLSGATAQHTGEGTSPWSGHRSGPGYATQGNLLVGPQVLDAVAASFESTAGSGRGLSDRLIAALSAGQAQGGDARKGRMQSAALMVADPRPGIARRPDGQTVDISVCENAAPVAELRRIHDAISGTLGYRELAQVTGADVWQLKVILHALGYFQAGTAELERGDDAFLYTQEAVDAVDRFRTDQGLSTGDVGSPAGLVDAATVERLWSAVAAAGKEPEVRARLADVVRIRR